MWPPHPGAPAADTLISTACGTMWYSYRRPAHREAPSGPDWEGCPPLTLHGAPAGQSLNHMVPACRADEGVRRRRPQLYAGCQRMNRMVSLTPETRDVRCRRPTLRRLLVFIPQYTSAAEVRVSALGAPCCNFLESATAVLTKAGPNGEQSAEQNGHG